MKMNRLRPYIKSVCLTHGIISLQLRLAKVSEEGRKRIIRTPGIILPNDYSRLIIKFGM
ncbi:hypothetical protein PVA17_09000 [Lysinibacillus sp. CNPSo 3705]|uniref:hypothetical protein n=1 Tax=Lysinibacillus sp. CNPSo 3705 TaxID=3028148 RepID=UPI0023648C9B|nr:hypothetical protein [Lysinibacillus sp. CNPSo 3705]MDD1502893.1 hypothetical protein [Lysinibacillus sp. CNPSo 3705]